VLLGFGFIAVGLHLVDVEDGGEALAGFEGGVGGDRLGGLLGWEAGGGEDFDGGHFELTVELVMEEERDNANARKMNVLVPRMMDPDGAKVPKKIRMDLN